MAAWQSTPRRAGLRGEAGVVRAAESYYSWIPFRSSSQLFFFLSFSNSRQQKVQLNCLSYSLDPGRKPQGGLWPSALTSTPAYEACSLGEREGMAGAVGPGSLPSLGLMAPGVARVRGTKQPAAWPVASVAVRGV